MLLDCNLFEINISYGFGDIKAINLLCQQPPAQLIVTLRHALMTFREFVYHEVINRLESLALAGVVSLFFASCSQTTDHCSCSGHETSMHTQLAESVLLNLSQA